MNYLVVFILGAWCGAIALDLYYMSGDDDCDA